MSMSDVLQLVRTRYESKPPPRAPVGPGHAKVVARNEKWFITELLDKWRVDYERRKLHRHTGYFALNHVPYKTFANLKHTDVYDLLGEHLGILMNRRYAFMQLYSRNQHAVEKAESSDCPELHNTIVVVCDEVSEQDKLLPPSKTGGLTAIRSAVSSDNRVLRDVAAGTSIRTALEQSCSIGEGEGMDTKEQLKSSQRRYLVHQDVCPLPGSDRDAPPTTNSLQNEAMDSNVPQDGRHQRDLTVKTVGPQLYVALAAVHFKNHAASSGTNKPVAATGQLKETIAVKRHQRRHAMAKLKSIHAILCCLHNIKSRDLRSHAPLAYSTVKVLASKPLHSLSKGLPHHPHQHHLHVDVHHHHHASSTPQIPHRHSPHHPHRGHNMASRHVRLDDPDCTALPVVETWEDVLHLNRELAGKLPSSSSTVCPSHTSGQAPAMQATTTTAANAPRLPRIGSTSTNAHQKSHKVLPPWQQQIMFVKNKNESLKRDPAKKLQECIDLFQRYKSETSQHIKSMLKNRESQQQIEKHLLTKLEHLTLGANMDVCLERMREQAYLILNQERLEEQNKPAWFSLLEKEVKAVFGAQDKEGKLIVEKLKLFIQIEFDTIQHVIEKMCLLIMSLPASQLSIQPVISAIEFVLEHVLKQSPKLLSQLKNLRQLPPMTTELLPTPVYLFGQRV